MKLRVTNVPVLVFLEADVEIPDGLDEAGIQDAVDAAFRRGDYDLRDARLVHETEYELDITNGWEWSYEEKP